MACVEDYQKYEAPDEYFSARRVALETTYVPSRKAAVVGIDGYPSSGKTPLAAWLSWQLGCPVINLDEFREGQSGYEIRSEEVHRLIVQRLRLHRPIVVEGLFLLDVMQKIGIQLDCHIWAQIDDYDPFSDFNGRMLEYTKLHRKNGVKPDHICRVFSQDFDKNPYPGGSRAWDREEAFNSSTK